MKIAADWLAAGETQAVFDALAPWPVWAVGGCVRNALLAAPVSDIDLATPAHPETVSMLAERAGLRVVPTGIAHGTVTVISGGIPHEVTTFRRDEETDGRHAVVAFSDRMEEDAARRDFTMNALYATREGEVIDPLGGLPDLLARRVRFVGVADERIREDYLRILRFFRFHAWFGDPADGLDADGLAACVAGADGVDGLSAERVGAEVKKLLSAPDPAPAVAAMAACGVLARVLPGADPRFLAVLVHLEAGAAPDPMRRLAIIGGDTGRLCLSRAEGKALSLFQSGIAGGGGPGELAYRHGRDAALSIGLLRGALGGGVLLGWEEAVERGAYVRFPVRAADLSGLSGPQIGERLRLLERRWIDSGFEMSREELLSGK